MLLQTPRRTSIFPAALAAVVAYASLVVLARVLPPDGRERSDAAQFLGRFHPLIVHAPVALLLLVPAMELAALRRRWVQIRPAAGWVLAVAAGAAFVAAFDGWLLARSGGYRGRDVTRHMWGGIWLTAACAAAYLARPAAGGRLSWALYGGLLAAATGLMIWTGHGGGSIAHGDGYLTDRMPGRVRTLLGLPPKAAVPAEAAATTTRHKAGPGSVDPANPDYFALHIAPLLDRSCVSCHRAAKHKGGLRLDSYAALMRGGEDGPAVVPGDPLGSELLRRVRLAPSDDDYMPSDGDKPLAPEEVRMIERWIAAGAKSG